MNKTTDNNKQPTRRAYSLDALRGYAILTMVLSATVVYGILPAWMYHAQEPPPTHAYQPDLAGLTWVDLVFPFFLFAMGDEANVVSISTILLYSITLNVLRFIFCVPYYLTFYFIVLM